MDYSPFFDNILRILPEQLSSDELFLKDLLSCTNVVGVKKGDYLIRVGDSCHNAYFINRGLFINLFINQNGNECVTGFSSDVMYPFVSTIGYFTKLPSKFEVKAIEDGELLCFSRADLERLSFAYPAFSAFYKDIMIMIISKFYSLFAIRQTTTAEEFIQYLYKNHQWIVSRVPDKYIAQYIGVTDSWYCKLKKRVLY